MTRPVVRHTSSEWSVPALVFALILIGPRFAAAQERSDDPPAHISLVEGSAVLERDGRTETAPSSMPLLAGDRVRTQAGRVEVLFADGSTLHLDSNTLVDFQSDEVIRLLEGRVRLNITGPERQVAYRIDAPSAWVQITQPGEYRVSVAATRGGEVELAVLRGFAELVNEDGTTALRAGERAYANPGSAPSYAYVFNSAAWDAFDQWSEARRDERLGISAQYLPADVRSYSGTLDRYGSWRHEPSYGYVWYPRVSVGWRPYYHGRWAHLRPYGWTWIGADPWGWATHHYGRWGFSAGAWFWIPGRHWGPAWVSWAYAPGYVSWCPLGWNNRPLFSFVNVNIFGGRRYNPWHAWTVVPHRSFGTGRVNVSVNVVNVNRIDVRTRRAFTPRERAPEYRHYAVPRGSTPIRVAGTGSISGASRDRAIVGTAVPRSSAGSPRAGDSSFRTGGSTGGQLTGPGFPASSREPRTAAPATRTAPRQGSGAIERGAPSAAPGAPRSERRAVPRQVTPAAPQAPRQTPGSIGRSAPSGASETPRVERRSVPRQVEPNTSQAPQRTQPSRRAVPQNDRAPQAPRRSNGTGAAMAPPSSDRYRVAPRSERSSAPPAAAPGRGVNRPPQSDYRSAPRAAPRSSPRSSAPPAYRGPDAGRRAPAAAMPSAPRSSGPSRSVAPSRPSGRTPSAAPSQRSGPRSSAGPAPRSGSRGGAAPAARSRGGQQSGGRAVRKGG
jgi:FecR protein